MGVVYKVLMPVTERVIALKLLDPAEIMIDIVGLEKIKSIFTAEATTMAQLRTPYIVDIWDFDSDENNMPFFTMEYYCQNLGDMIGEQYRVEKKSRLISPEKAVHYGEQILSGLSSLHQAGIIHRDIKPFNIMISDQDSVKICDFGLSKQRGETFASPKGLLIGSPYYTAPEQMRAPELATEQSDLYSVGVLLYRMLTGELPSMKQFSLSEINSLYDHKWDNFFIKTLSLQPNERYLNAQEMLTALKDLHLHWDETLQRICEVVPEEKTINNKSFLRTSPLRASGINARKAFGVNTLFRPKTYLRNQFTQVHAQTIKDDATNLIWQLSGSDNPLNWEGATKYIRSLNSEKFAGSTSWRLPTVNELLSLLNEPSHIDTICSPQPLDQTKTCLWSSDWRSPLTSWYVNFDIGYAGWQNNDCFFYARAVC